MHAQLQNYLGGQGVPEEHSDCDKIICTINACKKKIIVTNRVGKFLT